VSEFWSWPISERKALIHAISFAACVPTIYSASVLDSAVKFCFFELQVMAPLQRRNTLYILYDPWYVDSEEYEQRRRVVVIVAVARVCESGAFGGKRVAQFQKTKLLDCTVAS
jgi:hypothetical protein